MPLSEQEQRLLEEMERNLYRNDADFVQAVGGRRGGVDYRRLTIGVLIALLGIGALVAGVALQIPVIGILGFAAMFAGVLFSMTRSRPGAGQPSPVDPVDAARGSRQSRPKAGFMDRLNDRWDRRQDGQG